MDTCFLSVYAIGLYASGILSSRLNHSLVISIGMACTGIICMVFGIITRLATPVWLFLVLWGLNGLSQSTGWPCSLAIMSKWTIKKYSGLILGAWSVNANFGDILGSLFYMVCHSISEKW